MKCWRHSAQKSNLASAPPIKLNPQFLAVLLLLVLGETVLGLHDLELSTAAEGDEADTQVGASKVDGEVLAGLLTRGPLWVSIRWTTIDKVSV